MRRSPNTGVSLIHLLAVSGREAAPNVLNARASGVVHADFSSPPIPPYTHTHTCFLPRHITSPLCSLPPYHLLFLLRRKVLLLLLLLFLLPDPFNPIYPHFTSTLVQPQAIPFPMASLHHHIIFSFFSCWQSRASPLLSHGTPPQHPRLADAKADKGTGGIGGAAA